MCLSYPQTRRMQRGRSWRVSDSTLTPTIPHPHTLQNMGLRRTVILTWRAKLKFRECEFMKVFLVAFPILRWVPMRYLEFVMIYAMTALVDLGHMGMDIA